MGKLIRERERSYHSFLLSCFGTSSPFYYMQQKRPHKLVWRGIALHFYEDIKPIIRLSTENAES